MNRNRLILVLILVLVIVGGAVAFVLLGQGSGGGGGETPNTTQVAQPDNNNNNEGQNVEPTVPPTITPAPVVPVVIAIQNIGRGTPITAQDVSILEWPAGKEPQLAFSEPSEVIGKIARTDIYQEQTILTNMLTEDINDPENPLAGIGSDAAAILPDNRVAVAVPIDRLTSVAYAIQPGDRVDIMASFLFIDVDRVFQSKEPNSFSLVTADDSDPNVIKLSFSPSIRGIPDSRILPGIDVGALPVIVEPSEEPRPRLATQRTITDAIVVYTGNFPINGRIFKPAPTPTPDLPTATPASSGGNNNSNQPPPPPTVPPRPDIVTIAVPPQDAVVLTWMLEAGIPLTFALRPARATLTSLGPTDTVSLDFILDRYRIDIPEKFDYNIEPAIRSIRQIEIGNRISLSTRGE